MGGVDVALLLVTAAQAPVEGRGEKPCGNCVRTNLLKEEILQSACGSWHTLF